jgi:hypothetical protein
MSSNSIAAKKVSFNNISPNPARVITSVKDSINNIFFGSDISVAFTIILGLTTIAIGSIIMFENVLPTIRTQFSNNITAALASIAFIFIIFKFMGSNINILGKEFDTGMILYIASIALLLVLCSG